MKFETAYSNVFDRGYHQPRCVDKYFSNSHFLSLSLPLICPPFFCSFISWKISSLAFIYIPRYKSTLVISISPRMIVPILYIFFPPSILLLASSPIFTPFVVFFTHEDFSRIWKIKNPRKKKKIERNILRDKFINSSFFFFFSESIS